MIRAVRRHLDPDGRNIEHWPFFMGRHHHIQPIGPTGVASHHRVDFGLIRRGDPFQGVALMPRLPAPRLSTRLTQTGGPLRLGIAVTGRRLTAVSAGLARVFPNRACTSFNAAAWGLHVPRQHLDLLTHLGKKLDNRFFPVQEGPMDLVTGGESKASCQKHKHPRRVRQPDPLRSGQTRPSVSLTRSTFQTLCQSTPHRRDTLIVTEIFNGQTPFNRSRWRLRPHPAQALLNRAPASRIEFSDRVSKNPDFPKGAP
jgi:hypothetical protein